jgi:hypothetical protein
MTAHSKLILSNGELQLMTNTEWILTKRTIIDKINVLFGALAAGMKDSLQQQGHLPAVIIASTPKIAKGENYLQLPYVILDYPRQFEKTGFFAVRTMFWWGNFFSCTLHLSGSYKKLYEELLLKNSKALQLNDWYVCVNENEWQHHFENDNYVPANALTQEEIMSILSQQHFIKVAAKFSLQQWKEADVLLEKTFADLLELLKL